MSAFDRSGSQQDVAEEYRLVHNSVLPYTTGRFAGLAHVRRYEADGVPPAVLVGWMKEAGGQSPMNAPTDVALAIQTTFFPDGQCWRYLQYQPDWTFGRDWPEFSEIRFATRRRPGWPRRVRTWLHHHRGKQPPRLAASMITADGAQRYAFPPLLSSEGPPWLFAGPSWQRCRDEHLDWPASAKDALTYAGDRPLTIEWPTQVRIPCLLGATLLDVWPSALYTADQVAGDDAATLAADIKQVNDQQADAETGFVEAWTNTDPTIITTIDHEPDTDQRD